MGRYTVGSLPKPTVTFYRNVQGRVKRVGSKYHSELFANPKYKGVLTPDGKQLLYTTKFPDYDTAVSYVVTRKLGYEIVPPQFGHWIDAAYWTPLCINPAKEATDG